MEKENRDNDKKIPDVSSLVTTLLNTKISEVENKIPNTSGVVTTTVLNTKIGEVDSKIPGVSGLVRKTDYNTKISDIKAKYFTISDYNKFTEEILDAKMKEKGLVDKFDFLIL